MSHEDTVIEPASGITLICGANNIGKSVISIALYFLSAAKKYRSKVGKDWMIRHGQKQATVTVELEDDDYEDIKSGKLNFQTFFDKNFKDRAGYDNIGWLETNAGETDVERGEVGTFHAEEFFV